MVRRRVAVSVLRRLDTAADNVLRFADPLLARAYRVDYRAKLIGVSLEEGV